MVSTWRYWSFKELNPGKPRSPLMLVVMGAVIFAIWNWSQPVLLVFSPAYVASGILIRAGGLMRRYAPDDKATRRSRLADTISLIGGDTLLGREVREVFGESSLGEHLRLVAADEEETGKLTEIDGAAAFLAKLEPDAVEDAAVVVLAGTAKSSRDAMAANPAGLVVDLTYVTEDDADARVRAPQVEGPDYEPRSHRPAGGGASRRHGYRDRAGKPACFLSGRAGDRAYLRTGQRAREAPASKNCSSRPSACWLSKTCRRRSSTPS